MQSSADPFTGTRYRAIGRLGEGGMGEVWEVEHVQLKTSFAAKLISPTLAADRRFLDRVQIEAKALAKLRHDNLVRVTDAACSADGRWFFVMEKLTGRD